MGGINEEIETPLKSDPDALDHGQLYVTISEKLAGDTNHHGMIREGIMKALCQKEILTKTKAKAVLEEFITGLQNIQKVLC